MHLLLYQTGSAHRSAVDAARQVFADRVDVWVEARAHGLLGTEGLAGVLERAPRSGPERRLGMVFGDNSALLRSMEDPLALIESEATWEHDVADACREALGVVPAANVCVYREADLQELAVRLDPLAAALKLIQTHPHVAVSEPGGRVTTGPGCGRADPHRGAPRRDQLRDLGVALAGGGGRPGPRVSRRVVTGAAMIVATSATIQLAAALAHGLFSQLGPTGASSLRFTLGAAILLVAVRPSVRGRDRATWRAIVAYGVSLAALNLTFFEAIERIPLGLAVTFAFIAPLVIALAGSRRRRDVGFALLAAAGVVTLGGIDHAASTTGIALAVASGVRLGLRRLRRRAASAGAPAASTASPSPSPSPRSSPSRSAWATCGPSTVTPSASGLSSQSAA